VRLFWETVDVRRSNWRHADEIGVLIVSIGSTGVCAVLTKVHPGPYGSLGRSTTRCSVKILLSPHAISSYVELAANILPGEGHHYRNVDLALTPWFNRLDFMKLLPNVS
jgi:hypothetical protein